MSQQIIPNDLQVQGTLTCEAFIPPVGSISPTGTAGTGAPGAYHQAANIQQQEEKIYCQESSTTAAVERRVIHVVRGLTATLLDLAFGAVVANIGAATVVFDLLKNGASILTGTVTLTSGTAAYSLVSGSFSSASAVQGDVFELKVVSATAGGGTIAKGVFARLALREDPS